MTGTPTLQVLTKVPWIYSYQSVIFNPRNLSSDSPMFNVALLWIDSEPEVAVQGVWWMEFLTRTLFPHTSFKWNFRFQYTLYAAGSAGIVVFFHLLWLDVTCDVMTMMMMVDLALTCCFKDKFAQIALEIVYSGKFHGKSD
eukprot:TRINITY_DN477_c0_g1_i1.p1 TRINITY_DN477_c0_g1~~TRINITY_DN477_c0_g1_i1.p1  ORF type:complete len:141 (+),score=16.39 TRINITY_DN477_c0_g1_i1:253-675(+)